VRDSDRGRLTTGLGNLLETMLRRGPSNARRTVAKEFLGVTFDESRLSEVGCADHRPVPVELFVDKTDCGPFLKGVADRTAADPP